MARRRSAPRGAGSPRRARRGAPATSSPVDEHRLVVGERAEVVLEHDEVEPRDLGIGGVQVRHVDLARGERRVGEVVLEPAHVALRQAIARPQRGPAVTAIHELVR